MRIACCIRPPRGDDPRHRLFLRIESQGLTRYVSLGERIDAQHWNARAREARRSAPNAAALNAMLRRAEATAEAEAQRLRLTGRTPSGDEVKDAVVSALWPTLAPAPSAPATPSVLATLDRHEVERRAAGRIASANHVHTTRVKLAVFLAATGRGDDLSWPDLTADTVRAWQKWMLSPAPSGSGLGTNSAAKYLSTLRAIARDAVRDGLLDQAAFPFFAVRIEQERTRKPALSAADIDAIARTELAQPEAMARDAWMVAFYAGGMRFSDVARLRWDDVRGSSISYVMGKTGRYQSVPLLPEAATLLETYRAAPAPGGWVFPLLDGREAWTAAAEHRRIASMNAYINRLLKVVADEAGVPIALTFHMARHSLARYLRAKGWDVRAIQQVLRHSSVAITERYLSDLDDDGLGDAYRGAFGG